MAKTKDIEEETVAIVRKLFRRNNDIESSLSENDKTSVVDGFIRYKGLQFDVQIKGSENDTNKAIKTKYLEHINHQNLIYFYCTHVFSEPKVYYKIFTKKEFAESSLYDNYQDYNYSITFNKKAIKGKARYIEFKLFDIDVFINDLKYLYKNNLPTKTAYNIGELFGDIEPNGEEIEFNPSIKIKIGSNFGEHEIINLSRVVNERGKLINKVFDGTSFGIALGNNIVEIGMLKSIIKIGEKTFNIEGKNFIVKSNIDPFIKKGTVSIGEHKFIMDSESMQEDDQNSHITGTADYNILTEDVDGLENFILFFSQFSLAQDIKDRFAKDLETSKNFNTWLANNKLDKTITTNINNRIVLYSIFIAPLTTLYTVADLGNNKYLLFYKNKSTQKYDTINTIDKLSANFKDIKIDGNYFLLIINEYMHKGISLNYLFNIQNIDFRQEILRYSQIFQSYQDLLGILVVMAIHYYIYSKDEGIYDLLERSFLNNIKEESCFINYMQLKRHKGLKLTVDEEERLNELSNNKITSISLTVNIILGNNYLVKKLYNQLSNDVQEAFRYSPIFELVDNNTLE